MNPVRNSTEKKEQRPDWDVNGGEQHVDQRPSGKLEVPWYTLFDEETRSWVQVQPSEIDGLDGPLQVALC